MGADGPLRGPPLDRIVRRRQSGKGRVGPSGGPLAVDRSRPWAGARPRAGRIPGTTSDGSAPAGADAEGTGPAGQPPRLRTAGGGVHLATEGRVSASTQN